MPRRPNLQGTALAEVRDEFIACKGGPLRHRWDLVVASPDQRPQFGVLALFRCERCGTERHDIFSRVTGMLLSRWYDYPDGYYEAARGLDGLRLTADEVRLEWAARQMRRRQSPLLVGTDEEATLGQTARATPGTVTPMKRAAQRA